MPIKIIEVKKPKLKWYQRWYRKYRNTAVKRLIYLNIILYFFLFFLPHEELKIGIYLMIGLLSLWLVIDVWILIGEIQFALAIKRAKKELIKRLEEKFKQEGDEGDENEIQH